MRIVGLTGSIGAGKTTVSDLLRGLGAHVIDADVIAREVVEPGTAGLREVIDSFGEDLVDAKGTLDRAELARRVFPHPELVGTLNSIIHPLVFQSITREIERLSGTDFEGVVVLVVPLLVEGGKARYPLDATVVVDVDPEVAVERLVQGRGLSEEDARARLAAQVPREKRLELADIVIDNSGTVAELRGQTERLWQTLLSL